MVGIFLCHGKNPSAMQGEYYVDTVGKNTAAIKAYIQNQLKEDLEYNQMLLVEYIDPFTGEPVVMIINHWLSVHIHLVTCQYDFEIRAKNNMHLYSQRHVQFLL